VPVTSAVTDAATSGLIDAAVDLNIKTDHHRRRPKTRAITDSASVRISNVLTERQVP
jgi:hypothetical protein